MRELRATYDNPATDCREWWVDGKLDGAIARALLVAEPPPPTSRAFAWLTGARATPWKSGHVDGDLAAIPADRRP